MTMNKPKPEFKRVTAEQKDRAFNLVTINPRLSIRAIARHLDIGATTVSCWFDECNLKRWTSR
jgi:transposase-like protein